MEIIQGIIKRKSLDFGMAIPVDLILTKTSKSWMDHFDKWNIPTDQLMNVYEEAMGVRDERSMFTPTTMFNGWKSLKDKKVQKSETGMDQSCSQCHGTFEIRYYDLEKGDITIVCPYH